MGFENPLNFLAEALKKLWFAIVHMWDPVLNWFHAIALKAKMGFEAALNFPVEALKKLWFAIVHMWDPVLNWLHVIAQKAKIGFEDALNFPVEKLKELWFAIVHMWDSFLRWLHKAFSPETWADRLHRWLQLALKQLQLAFDNTWYPFLSWFDKVFPPDTRAERLRHWIQVALPFVALAVVVLLIYCFFKYCGSAAWRMMEAAGKCCSWCWRSGVGAVRTIGWWCRGCWGGAEKMMKAPGRDFMMPRSVFEADPKGYFLNLRARP